MPHRINEEVAGRLEEAAWLLRDQRADPYRVNAYQRAAAAVRASTWSVNALDRKKGLDGLEELRGVGDTIGRAIRDLLVHGRWATLDRLRGESHPVPLLQSVPGIGRRLADRLHEELGLETLADLEAAGHDGRLETIAASETSGCPAYASRWRIGWDGFACRRAAPPTRLSPSSWMWIANTG